MVLHHVATDPLPDPTRRLTRAGGSTLGTHMAPPTWPSMPRGRLDALMNCSRATLPPQRCHAAPQERRNRWRTVSPRWTRRPICTPWIPARVSWSSNERRGYSLSCSPTTASTAVLQAPSRRRRVMPTRIPIHTGLTLRHNPSSGPEWRIFITWSNDAISRATPSAIRDRGRFAGSNGDRPDGARVSS